MKGFHTMKMTLGHSITEVSTFRHVGNLQSYPNLHHTNDPLEDVLLTNLIEQGDWSSASKRIQSNPREILDHRNGVGHNALHCAVLKCDSKNMRAIKLIHKMLDVSHFTSDAALITCYDGGWTSLHLCCRNLKVPGDILIKIAKANPRTLTVQDDEGDTPLHSACRYGASQSTLQSLIEIAYRNDGIYSSTSIFAMTDFEGGDTPLHSAIYHNAPPEIISLFLDAYPPSISVLTSSNNLSPLHVAIECCRYDIVQAITRSNAAIGCVYQLLAITSRQGHNVLHFLWDKYVSGENDKDEVWDCIVQLLLDAEKDLQEIASVPQTEWNLLFAAINLGPIICPIEILSRLISLNPHVLKQKCDKGRLPLHHAILQYPNKSSQINRGEKCSTLPFPDGHSDARLQHNQTTNAETKDSDEFMFSPYDPITGTELVDKQVEVIFDDYDENECIFKSFENSPLMNSFIQLLLRSYREAAMIHDADGVYPLQMAIQANLPWKNGVEEIFYAYPHALQIPDKEGLLPFMLAKSLDCIYHLLYQSPVLLTNHTIEDSQNSVQCYLQPSPKRYQLDEHSTNYHMNSKRRKS